MTTRMIRTEPQKLLPIYLHGAIGAKFPASEFGLHDFIKIVIGHMSGQQQLRRAHVVERQTLDTRNVHPEVPMDPRTFYAHYYSEISRQPSGI